MYATPRRDQSVITEDMRKAEIFINNRSGVSFGPSVTAPSSSLPLGSQPSFVCSELYR